MTIRMVRVPIPADGTRRLAEDPPVALHTLDILFKSQVDVEDAPGQLQDVTVGLVGAPEGPELSFTATVEDAETGETRPLSVRLPIEVPSAAPEVGGPLPPPPDEDDLEWEDFPEPAAAGAAADEGDDDDHENGGPPAGKGLEALLSALVSPDLEGSIEALESRAQEEEAEPEAPEAPEAPTGLMSPAEEAHSFLKLLLDHEHLELTESGTVDDLVPGALSILDTEAPEGRKARALAAWLLEQDVVEELYIDDDSLEDLLARW